MPTSPDATGMKHMLVYHASEPVPLPEEEASHTIASRIKEAMVAESALIASNIGVFLGSLSIAAIGITDIATGGGSWQDNTVLGLLVGTIVFLFRLLMVERKENKDEVRRLWERLAKKDDDEEEEPKPARKRK